MLTHDLHRKAHQLLDSPEHYPGLPVRTSARVQLRVWSHPSFEPFASWALLLEKQQTFVRRVVWHHSAQMELEPVTYGAEAPIEPEIVHDLIESLQAISLPVHVPVASVGLDGTRCGVEVLDHMSSSRLAWWEDQPLEWQSLREWHVRAIRRFEQALPARTAR